MYKPGQDNKGKGKVGVAKGIVKKGKDVKRTESPMSVSGRGQASSSPMSEDGNEKELLKSICQLHRQIRADHTPAKNIVSAIGELKTEIQDLISELDDSEENTEAPKQPAKSNPGDRKATASGTNKSKDLYTAATTICRKLNSDLLETRKELKKISKLAVTVGQEVGFQPDTSNAVKYKEGLSFNATEALAYIKQRNTKLNQQLDILRKKITTNPTCLNAQQQPEEKQQKEEKLPKSTQKWTDNPNPVKDQRQNKEDRNESREGKKETREVQNEASGQISPVQFDTNLQIVSETVVYVGNLQNSKITFESKLSQVLDFAMSLEEGKVELMGSEEGNEKLNPSTGMEARNKKDKEKSKRKEEGHDDSNAAPPVGGDNRKFEQAIQLLQKVYGKMKDELSKMDQLANRTIELAMKEGDRPIQDNTLLSQLERAIGDIEGDIKKLRHLETKNRDQIQKLKREIEIKVKDNEALHNRLSKLAGNKITEGNPNIANLGDPNRPTKIAEIYSEIYDNEWTDTLDFCLKNLGKENSEDDALQALNKTLIICYKICEEKSDEWIQKTKEKLQHCLRELVVDIQSDEILMQIIEGRKVDPDKRSQQLLKEIRPKKDLVKTKYTKDKEMSSKLYKMIIQNKFFEKCFTLCWKMIVQNPRMILVEGPSKGETYDRNIFKEFTSSGSKVVFTVWPALYLHKDGPLLVKGVLKVE